MNHLTCRAKAFGEHLISTFGSRGITCNLEVNREGRHVNGTDLHHDPTSEALWTESRVRKLAEE